VRRERRSCSTGTFLTFSAALRVIVHFASESYEKTLEKPRIFKVIQGLLLRQFVPPKAHVGAN